MEILRALGITATLLAGAAPAASSAAPSAEAVLRRVEDRHRGLADLTARFVQTYRSGLLGREVVERGTLSLKRPGRMLWEYKEPEKKTFVADGETFYFYVPADRQVVVRDGAGEKGVPALLLSGESILDQFEAQWDVGPPGRRLRLRPKKADPEIEQVFLEVDESARIRAIEVLDAQGNRSRFQFDAIRENVGLPDRLFRFQIPRGVEVIAG